MAVRHNTAQRSRSAPCVDDRSELRAKLAAASSVPSSTARMAD